MDSHSGKINLVTTKNRRVESKRPYHHGDLRAALIRAALSLIEEHGVKGLALSDAARLAGVSVAAPYRHFKDKEALLAEIAAEGFVLFRDALARASRGNSDDKVKCLVEMGVAYVDFALQHRSHFKVMWESGIPKAKYPELGKTAYEAYLLLQKAAFDLLPADNPDRQQALVSAAWSVVHGYAMLSLESELPTSGNHQSGRKLLRQALHLLLDQFATGPATKIKSIEAALVV
jgi:AcrR family transcriptional regulator